MNEVAQGARVPKVTVVAGYYNRAHALERTITSVLGQTFEDFEFIVFDDASTDDTALKLQELSESLADQRLITKFHEKNVGFTQGLIDAIREARGEYIAIVDAGDYCAPRRLERQVELLDTRPDVGAVGCWYINVIPDAGMQRPRRPIADNMDLSALLKSNIFSHGEVTYRKATYDKVGGYRKAFVFSQDYDLWLRMIKVSKFATVREFLYERYVFLDGISYNVNTFIDQIRYARLARQLATTNDEAAAALYEKIRRDTIRALVSTDDKIIQRNVEKAIIRAILYKNTNVARNLIDHFLSSKIKKALLYGVALAAEYVPLFRTTIAKLAGIQNTGKNIASNI